MFLEGLFYIHQKKKTSKIKHSINIILQFLLDKKILKFLVNFADNVVVLSEVKK